MAMDLFAIIIIACLSYTLLAMFLCLYYFFGSAGQRTMSRQSSSSSTLSTGIIIAIVLAAAILVAAAAYYFRVYKSIQAKKLGLGSDSDASSAKRNFKRASPPPSSSPSSSSSPPLSSSPPSSSSPQLSFTIKKYGVLGKFMKRGGRVVQNGTKPDSNIVICDPAGLRFIQANSTRGAGGSSKSIYEFLKITSFPIAVKEHITKSGMAKYHKYADDKHVIHVVGPDFREDDATRDAAVTKLARAYKAVFEEFFDTNVTTLRLLPISAATLPDKNWDVISTISFEAIRTGIDAIDRSKKISPPHRKVEFCIYHEKEYDEYNKAKRNFDSDDIDDDELTDHDDDYDDGIVPAA